MDFNWNVNVTYEPDETDSFFEFKTVKEIHFNERTRMYSPEYKSFFECKICGKIFVGDKRNMDWHKKYLHLNLSHPRRIDAERSSECNHS